MFKTWQRYCVQELFVMAIFKSSWSGQSGPNNFTSKQSIFQQLWYLESTSTLEFKNYTLFTCKSVKICLHSFWLLSLVTITTMLLYFLVFRSSFISLLNKMPFAYTLYWQSNNSKAINCLWIYEHIFMFIIYSMRSIDTNCQIIFF